MNFLISLLAAALLGQAPVPGRCAPAPKGPTPPPLELPAPASGKYLIGSQDLLKITVLDEPELSQSFRVDTDGYFSFPYINRVKAAGLTLNDVQEAIRAGLAAGYIRNPQVRVEIESYKSQSVMVSGEVRQPGKITMTGAMTVLKALAQAGSPTSTASSELTIAHQRKTGADATIDAEITRVNWRDLQLGKGTDVALADGDILNIPKAQTFFITGQIRNSGSFVLEPGMTVQQAIALAGGLTERGSDRRIHASRLVSGKLTEVSLKMEDRVMGNDVITVDQRFF